jgi:hypothetical protein
MRRLPLFLVLLLTACSAWTLEKREGTVALTGADLPAQRARVCILRPTNEAAGVTFPVRDNGTLVGATRGGTRFCYLAEPGEHHIVSEADTADTQTQILEAGRSYYLRQDVDAVLGAVKCRTIWLEEDQAQKLADQATEQVLVGAPSGEQLPGTPAYAPLKPRAAIGSN